MFQPARLAAADRATPLMCTSTSWAGQEFSCVMKSHGDERQRRASHSSATCGRWNVLIGRAHANKRGLSVDKLGLQAVAAAEGLQMVFDAAVYIFS